MMMMKIEFAHGCISALRSSARSIIWQSRTDPDFAAIEGNSFPFGAVGPSVEAWKPIPPSLTPGFASGPASTDGSNGKDTPGLEPIQTKMFKLIRTAMAGAVVVLASISGAAIADDQPSRTVVQSEIVMASATHESGAATARVIAFSDERSQIRFSASGLPAGLSIHPQTGVISGVIDREANRNGGSPFIIKVAVAQGTAASGISTISIIIENRAPRVVDDILRLSSKSTQLNVLANDSDPDGDRLILTDVEADYGVVAFTPTGIVAYAPNPGQPGADTITYRADDGHGGTAIGKISVIVK
jgi:hypothetical protein